MIDRLIGAITLLSIVNH